MVVVAEMEIIGDSGGETLIRLADLLYSIHDIYSVGKGHNSCSITWQLNSSFRALPRMIYGREWTRVLKPRTRSCCHGT